MDPAPRGVLDLHAGERWFDLEIRRPADDLAELVEHYWRVRWDLRGREPYAQHTLPHPSVHLVVEAGRSEVVGVTTGRFTRVLEGRGRAFGVKFRPAGFRPLLGSSVSPLTDRTTPVAEVFGAAGEALAERVLGLRDDSRLVEAAEAFVRSRHPAPDPNVATVNRAAERIMADRTITMVDQVVEATGIGKRRLQRLFADYVGVRPKWVIQRYRLHEAAERLADGGDVDLARLAAELGYFDQAHFAKDFKAIVGSPPNRYSRTVTRARGAAPGGAAHQPARAVAAPSSAPAARHRNRP
jgi:AraC-like DNA-binding protein